MKNKLNNILALGIGVMISLFILELFLQLFNPFGFRQKGDKIVLPTNFEMKYENKTITGLDSLIVHSKNSLGFRGDDMPTDFENWLSFIAIGGSTTECFYLSDGKDWVTQLGDKLSNIHSKTWVNNAGLDGHSTFGHQILLNEYVVPLKPKFALFLIGVNDVERKDLNRHDALTFQPKKNWKSFLKNNSELISLGINIKRSLAAKQHQLGHDAVGFGELKFVENVSDSLINKTRQYHQENFTAAFEKRIQQLINISVNNDITPILITQPTLVGSGIDSLTQINLETVKYCDDMGGKIFWEKLEVYNEVTRRVAKQNNIQWIDLANEMPKSTALFYDCIHFTNEGSKIVAEIVFEKLRGRIEERAQAQMLE